MCNQTVGLVAAELERHGIVTVALQLLRSVAEKLRPPTPLCLPFPHRYPLDTPGDPERQRAVLRAALGLAETPGPGPKLMEYRSGA